MAFKMKYDKSSFPYKADSPNKHMVMGEAEEGTRNMEPQPHDHEEGDTPMTFLGRLASKIPGKAGNIAGAALNPMGAVMDKTGMADTTLGKVLDPMSMLGKKM